MGTKLEAKTSIKLTNESVKALPLAAAGKHYVYDTERRGFCVRVTPTGKFYAVRLKVKGKEYQRSICRVEETTAVAARGKAEVIIGELRQGFDRNTEERQRIRLEREERLAEQKDREEAMTVAQALQDYYGRTLKPLKPRTVADYEGIMKRELKSIANTPLRDITREGVERLMATISRERGATRAVHAVRLLRALCKKNPDIAIQNFNKLIPKQRPDGTDLEHQDGKFIYAELLKRIDTHPSAKIALTMLLTGNRPDETKKVLVRDVDAERRTMTLPDPKNGKPHTIYMSKQLSEIILPLLKDGDGESRIPDAVLFPSLDTRYIWSLIEKVINVKSRVKKHIRPKDMRKMAGSAIIHLGWGSEYRDALLNHTPTDVGGRHYTFITQEDKDRAWQAVADYYSANTSNVITLPTKRAA